MRKWNKLLAMLLAMVMVFGLTATAFAAEGDKSEDPKTEATEPTEGEDKDEATEPAEGEDKDEATEPTEGEDKDEATEPTEGEDKDEAAEPTEGEEDKDEATEPTEGEDDKDEATEPTEPAEPAEPAAVTFSDVAENNWFYEFVMKMAAAEVVNGYTDGTFRPQGAVTWGQALKMALLTAKYEDAKPVEGGSWASGYIALAKAEGIIAEDAEIDHNKNITRVEMCELLAKALKVAASEKESIFSDTDNGYVMALVDLEVISVAETFNPDGELTRAELCKILASVPEKSAEPTEPADPAEPAEDEDKKDEADADKKDEADADKADDADKTDDADKADDADKDADADAKEPVEGDKEPADDANADKDAE